MNQASFFDTHGTAVLREVLNQIADTVAPFGDVVDNNALVAIAMAHGVECLTSIASALLDAASRRATMHPTNAADWESDLIDAARICVLAVIAGRLASGMAVQSTEPDAFPPIDANCVPTGAPAKVNLTAAAIFDRMLKAFGRRPAASA